MRTSEARVKALHRRMTTLKRRRELRAYLLSCAGACTVCLAMTILLALAVAQRPVRSPGTAAGLLTASIFAVSGALGYVVVALLSLCLGAMVTILCFRLREHRSNKEKQDDLQDR